MFEPPRIDVLESGARSVNLRLFRLHNYCLAVASIGGTPAEFIVERWDTERGEFLAGQDAVEVARN